MAGRDTAGPVEADSSLTATTEATAPTGDLNLSKAAPEAGSTASAAGSDTSGSQALGSEPSDSDASGSDNSDSTTPTTETGPTAPAAPGPTTEPDRDDGPTGPIHIHEEYQTSGLLGAAADPSLKELLGILHRHGARAAATARPSVVAAAKAESAASAPKKAERKSALAIAAQQEHDRYRPGAKRAHLAVWLIILAVLVVLGGGGWGVYTYVTHQYYVGNHDGKVAIFAGIPGDVAGISTNRVYESTDIQLTDLPLVWRDKVTGIISIDFNDLAQANSTVDQLRSLSEQCLERRDQRPASDPIPADGC
jgi:hypothetical protein